MYEEDLLFEEWKALPEEERGEIQLRLQTLLKRHASAVCWLKLSEPDPDIVNYAVYLALAKAHTFRGESKFSTWFHAIVLRMCKGKLRKKQQLREVSLDQISNKWFPGQETGANDRENYGASGVAVLLDGQLMEGHQSGEEPLLARFQLETFVDKLSPQERQLVQWKLEGLNEQEIAKLTGRSRAWASVTWMRIRRKLSPSHGRTGDGTREHSDQESAESAAK